MKSPRASGDIAIATVYTKKTISRYFNPRNVMSAQAGRRRFRLKRENPAFHEHSETVATGQIHEQNERRNRSDTTSTVTKITSAAGWMSLIPSPLNQAESPNRPEMGRKPSMPSGRGTNAVVPPLRKKATN